MIITGFPAAESAYVTEQDPEDRVQVLPPVNEPVESDVVKLTVPVGDSPVTVAVQVVVPPTVKGAHDTEVVVVKVREYTDAVDPGYCSVCCSRYCSGIDRLC